MATILFNGLLVGASGWALYVISPGNHPYAFTACAFSLCHGLLGLIESLKDSDGSNQAKDTSKSVMEIVPLPLVNIQLYLASQSNNIALGHGLFIIPLVFELLAKNFTESEENNIEVLKDLTILGNVVSLLFLAVNESSGLYGIMSLIAFLTKYGAMALENNFEGTGDNATLFGHAVFAYLTSLAIGAKNA